MNVAGLGIVLPGGAGASSLLDALNAGVPLRGQAQGKEPAAVLSVPPAAFAGKPVLAPARRADRFCKMSLLAAMEAMDGCVADPARIGIILATAFGPHGTVFKFVNDLLDFGDEKASPTVFSQSVHAAAASMIAVAAGLHGPTLTVADLAMPFEEALTLAECWLASDRCDAVLVGAVDEVSDVLAQVARRKWALSPDGIARPSSNGQTACVPGEGAVFFRLERGQNARLSVEENLSPSAACHLVNAGALGSDDAELRKRVLPSVPTLTFVSLLGSTRIGSAFHLAIALLMRRENRFFPDVLPLASCGFPGGGNGREWAGGLDPSDFRMRVALPCDYPPCGRRRRMNRTMTADDVMPELKSHVAFLLGAEPATIAVDQPLHLLGLDSMGFVDLLVFIEKQFGLSLMNSGLSQDDFASLAVLAERIAGALRK